MDEKKELFNSAAGAGASLGLPVTVGGSRVNCAEDRLPGADAAELGQAARERQGAARRPHDQRA